MGEHEGQLETLEEKFVRLREEGLSDKEILRGVLEENFDSDIDELVRITGMGKLDIGRIKGSVSRVLKRRQEKKEVETPPEPPTPYKTELDATAILKEILRKHPDISPKVIDEICSWAEYGPIHPTQLVYLLQSMRGIQSTTANIVAQKYSLALQKAQQEGRVQIPPPMYSPQLQQPQWAAPFPTPSQPQHPWGFQMPLPLAPTFPPQQPTPSQQPTYPQPSWYPQPQPPQDIRSMIREELRAREPPKEAEAYVDIEEPVRNAEGQVIIGPDDRPITKRMRVPASQASQFAAPREDTEMRVLDKLAKYKELFGPKEELTTEKIREIIRQETPTPPAKEEKPPITIEEVKQVSSEAAQSVARALIETQEKERKEDERFKRLEDTIRSTASAKAVEGYREDSFRILGQGLQEAAGVVRERKPVEVIIREGGPLVFGGVPSKEVEAGAGKGLIDRFKERGWVTEQ